MHTVECPQFSDINFVLHNDRPKLYDYSISIYDDSETNCYCNDIICGFDAIIDYYDERKSINTISKNMNFCSFCSSNHTNIRENTVDLINKYKNITCIGKVKNNIGYYIEDLIQYCKNKFKFFLAIENTLTSNNPSYISEKISHAYCINSIPIYLGCSCANKLFNPKSYIDINDCSDEEIITKIREVDEHDDIYLDMMHEYPFIHKDIKNEYFEKIKKFILNALNI